MKVLAFRTLCGVFQDSKDRGLLSIYLWGSMTSPDYNPTVCDVDSIGILTDKANFEEMEQMRDWLPGLEPRLKHLHINFFYLSELKGGPQRSRIARLHHAEQAVSDFPNWQYVCGKKFTSSDFPVVTPRQALKHQVMLTKSKMEWVLSGKYGDKGLEYFCKGLAWLCYNIHKISSPPSPFSWKELKNEATDETRELIQVLLALKSNRWSTEAIKAKMPYLLDTTNRLIAKYKN